jgi:hypothetical protein
VITALSLRQPWAWCVLHLGKHLENRRWSTDWRGNFLIHASKGLTKAEYYDCLETCKHVLGSTVISKFPPLKDLPRGGIVGAATLVDVLPRCPSWPCEHPWHMPDQDRPPLTQFGFMLENVRPSPRFVPCVGHLGFFRVPDEVVGALRAAG